MSQLETSIWGTLIGFSIVSMSRNSLTLLGVNAFWQDLILGVVLGGFAIDQIAKEKQRK